ncbi:MAG: DUF3623 domain-containing protein [Gammaproteobacteria bacterium]|nr:DUF3623 domain-containing protein [Gammaproteobacteria bacterium]
MIAAAVFAVFIWWFSTGLVFYLHRLPAASGRLRLGGSLLVAALAAAVVVASAESISVLSAFMAFGAGLVLWGCIEFSYYSGYVTGTHRRPCPPELGMAGRLVSAVQSSLYHELLVIGVGLALLSLTAGEPNSVASSTYLVLWLMRWSAKLNIFLGVSNLHTELLPEHLRYLASYATQKPINLLFPVSVTAATVTGVLLANAGAAGPTDFEAVSGALLATLLFLAVLEHWFLVLPVHDSALWSWALRPRPVRNLYNYHLKVAAEPIRSR